MNLVELLAEESAYDQVCKYGHRVEDHAVYCHNTQWKDAPRKCRRTWWSGDEIKDEDCAGFKPNSHLADSIIAKELELNDYTPQEIHKGFEIYNNNQENKNGN